ncbi:MAG: prolipoprotein diacylglyceryl transferase [Ruminococcus sp.]|nr:prolipoprotein diacylglyceryl transferase [Ruminococcus sp.]
MYNVSFPELGFEFKINPIAFSIGSVKIHWYGIIIAGGLLLALLYAYFSAKRFNVDRNKLFDCVLVGIITGIIGARAYYVLFKLDYYIAHPSEIIMINNGGLAIYGGIIGALIGGCITAKILKIKIFPVLDIAVLGFLIGQGIGRWGNFFNQEAFGTPTGLPWGMLSENTDLKAVHPCFLYESIWCLLGFVLIHFLSKRFQKYSGQVFYMYLVWYGFERMIVEGLRTDSLYLPFGLFGFDIRVSQLLSAIIFIAGIVLLIINRNKEDKFYDNHRRKKGFRSGKRAGSRGY